MPRKITEKQIETLILEWLNAQPDIFAFKVNTVGIFDPVKKIYRKNHNPYVHLGTSDIVGSIKKTVGVYGGQSFLIEVKTPKAYKALAKKGWSKQHEFLSVANKKGAMRGLITDSLDRVIDFINGIKATF